METGVVKSRRAEPEIARCRVQVQCHIYFDVSATCEHHIQYLHRYTIMAARSLRLALFALVALLVCSIYAQSTEKLAAKIDVGSFSTQEIEEQLQVGSMRYCSCPRNSR